MYWNALRYLQRIGVLYTRVRRSRFQTNQLPVHKNPITEPRAPDREVTLKGGTTQPWPRNAGKADTGVIAGLSVILGALSLFFLMGLPLNATDPLDAVLKWGQFNWLTRLDWILFLVVGSIMLWWGTVIVKDAREKPWDVDDSILEAPLP